MKLLTIVRSRDLVDDLYTLNLGFAEIALAIQWNKAKSGHRMISLYTYAEDQFETWKHFVAFTYSNCPLVFSKRSYPRNSCFRVEL